MNKKIKIQNQAGIHRQNGAALLVALVMIFMLSIMGISSMRGSTLERRMASNSIQTATTFQGAESTSELVLNDPDNLTRAFEVSNLNTLIAQDSDGEITPVELEVDLKQGIGLESTAQLRYVGESYAEGYSSNTFVALRFEVKGSSTAEAIRSKARVTQGAYRIAPGTGS